MARKSKKQREAESGQGIYRYETYASEYWDWSNYRIPESPVLISPNGWTDKDGKSHPSRKLADNAGHRCPRCPNGVLAWGNGGPFIWSMYMLWCPNCNGAWHANHKYVWGVVQEVLRLQGIEVEDTRKEEEETGDEDQEQGEIPETEGSSQLEVRADSDSQSSSAEKKPRKRRTKKSD